MNKYIKTLINANKDANTQIALLEETIADYIIATDKHKANFGNLCIALKGFRMVAEATEAMLINEDVVRSDSGEFYQKIKEETIVPPTTEGAGSDFDADANGIDKK